MPLSSITVESALAPFQPLSHVYIAYSGGIDSHVLLHLAASTNLLREKITSVYVHHGLQAEADAWARHAEKTSKNLGVDFLLLKVDAFAKKGESPEEAARNARYAALKSLIGDNDILLVAQHLEDQLETVLLQLLRGGGLSGLSGMPASAVFGQGFLLRPLLNTSKQSISDYAEHHNLTWVDDPSNLSSNFDRNFLRNEVIPLIKQRWPACDVTVARAAGHCAEARLLVAELSDEIFEYVRNAADNTLSISRLRTFTSAKQQLAVRHWFIREGLKMPSQAFVHSLFSQMICAKESGHPELISQGYSIQRYRDKLYLLKQEKPETKYELIWPVEQSSIYIGNRRTLSWAESSAGILLESWLHSRIVIKFRGGGEKIALPGRVGRHSLKNLFQEAGIPPWERKSIPLIYLNDKLAAIGDRWVSAEFHDRKKGACIALSIDRDDTI